MNPQMHADAGRFRRGRAKRDQGTQKHEAARGQKMTAHDGLLHDFVRVPVGVAIAKAGSTGPVDIEAGETSHFRDRTGANGVIVPDRPIPSGGTPNQMLTFRPCPRKLPETQKNRPNRTGTMNPVKALENHGQAIWLDFLARGFVAKGDLKALIDTDGVKGVTSNPSIFEKAIGSSDEYDGAIGHALKTGDRPVADLFEAVAIEDIQNAADVLRPVYDRLNGEDGFVSLEVSPYLAMDTKGTIAEAERLWKDVKRQNLMVKVPATPEGLPAIEHLIGEGISINITLLFSQEVYREVAEAYIAGLEKYVAKGGDPSHCRQRRIVLRQPHR